MKTREVPVLHKFTPAKDSTSFIFTPDGPFKCTHILLWFQKGLIVRQITIGHEVQLVQPTPADAFAAPVTIDVIEGWFKTGLLNTYLREHKVWPIELSISNPQRPIKIEFLQFANENADTSCKHGKIDIISLVGTQLVDDARIQAILGDNAGINHIIDENWQTPIRIHGIVHGSKK